MRAPYRAFSFPSLVVLAAATSAVSSSSGCSKAEGGDDAVHVSVAPSLVFPRGLLDSVTTLSLTVYDQSAGVDCDAATGTATGVTGATVKLASTQLASGNCNGSAKFCGPVSVSKSADATRVFSAQASDASGAVVANGCATTIVNQDTLDLAIKMIRFVPSAVCGNGTVEATEQCEPPGSASDPICDAQCHSKAILLSNAGMKVSNPFFLWPAQTGEPAGRFFSFFTLSGSNLDIAMRVQSDKLTRVSSPPAAQDNALIVPNTPNDFPPVSSANDQSLPVGTVIGKNYYVAFQDTNDGTLDVHLVSFDTSLEAIAPGVVGINGGATGSGEPGIQGAPSIAPGNGSVYVAWQDESDGQIRGRTYTPGTGLGTQNQISSGASNKNVKLAATPSGWLAVWESGSDVKLRAIGSNGTPSGAEQVVNDAGLHHGTQDHPGIAVLADGRVAVTWADHGTSSGSDIFVQRYDVDFTAVPGDQATRINDVTFAGDQVTPAIAGSTVAGGSFVVAWVDSASNQVRARLLGGSAGFLFNNVDGQNSEFQASPDATDKLTHVRANPTVAVGGASPFIAIGWEDQAGTTTGIYGRRFPAPVQ